MRIKIFSLSVVIATLYSCNSTPILKGEIEGAEFDKIHLCKIINEYYGQYEPIDSAMIVNGKFEIKLENISPQKYFIGNGTIGGSFFIEATDMEAKGMLEKGSNNRDIINWKVSGSPLQDIFATYTHKSDSIAQQKKMDKLSKQFYAAREKGDREIMKKIKDEQIKMIKASEPFIEDLNLKTIADNKDNVVGMYLYFSKQFRKFEYHTVQDITEGRKRIEEFGEVAKQSAYAEKMIQTLDDYEKCAIGNVAPDITGIDTTGTTKTLNDYRGMYVIVDFWSSGCKWCRLETPNLLKAYNSYKDKGFTVLGVSSDHKKEKWLEAIHEDKSYWDQILLERKDISPTMNKYCITGIPHIILIDPDGKILEKELRGEDIYKKVAKYIF